MRNIGRNLGIYLLVFIAVLSLSMFVRNMGSANEYKEIKFSQFASHLENGDYEKVNITERQLTGTRSNGDTEIAYSPSALEINWLENNILFPMMDEDKVELESDPPKSEYTFFNLLPTILMVLAMGFLFYFMMSQGGNKQAFQFGKNRARLYKGDGKAITFKDVAGLKEEKEELAEIVDFLKNPVKYDKLGARIPKGVLLVGHPGTGKTYISKATAGEAGVPFFTISGSDFVEMFVGVGASRVRDLFNEAKKNAPCIVFIDEIDAVGRRRGAGLGGGNDEREQTLNQLLVEMDGFDGNMGIIILAATNRPDVLDPALLRPGRFDRQIVIGMPDIKGREELFRLYTRNKPLADDVSPEILAKRTPGFSPADIENLINEAALLTARRNGTTIRMAEIEEATTKVMAGPQKKSRVISDSERRLTAYHEAGHAIVMRALPDSDPVHQITIIPRGMAGGFTMWLPEEDRFFETRGHMYNTIKHLLGGRVAEELKLEDISTGASNDLERATGIAREMITKYGFSKKLGPVSFSSNDEVFLGRDFSTRQNISDEVAAEIDREIRSILEDCYSDTRRILREHNAAFERVARALLLVETLDGDQFERLFTGEATPEMIKEEFDDDNRRMLQKNREEAAESARIDEEKKKEFERQMARMSDIEDAEKFADEHGAADYNAPDPYDRDEEDSHPVFVRSTDRHRKSAQQEKKEKKKRSEAKPEPRRRRRETREEYEEPEAFRPEARQERPDEQDLPPETGRQQEPYNPPASDSYTEREERPVRDNYPEHDRTAPSAPEEPRVRNEEPDVSHNMRQDNTYGREIFMRPRSSGPIKPIPINPVTDQRNRDTAGQTESSRPADHASYAQNSVPAYTPAPAAAPESESVPEPEPDRVPETVTVTEPASTATKAGGPEPEPVSAPAVTAQPEPVPASHSAQSEPEPEPAAAASPDEDFDIEQELMMLSPDKDRIVDMEDYQRATEILQQNILKHSRKVMERDDDDTAEDSSDQ